MRVGSNSDVELQHSFPDFNPNPVFETGLDGKVLYSNAAAKAVFGDVTSSPWLRDIVGQYANQAVEKTSTHKARGMRRERRRVRIRDGGK